MFKLDKILIYVWEKSRHLINYTFRLVNDYLKTKKVTIKYFISSGYIQKL